MLTDFASGLLLYEGLLQRERRQRERRLKSIIDNPGLSFYIYGVLNRIQHTMEQCSLVMKTMTVVTADQK